MDDMDMFLDTPTDLKPLEDVTPLDNIEDDSSKDKKEEDVNLPPLEVEGTKQIDTPPSVSKKETEVPKENENILSSIVNTIQEEGYFTLKDGETLDIKNAEDFLEVLNKIRDSAIEAAQSDWTDAQKEYFEAVNSGIPHETVVNYQQRQQQFANITEEVIQAEDNAELRKQILMANYTAKGFEPKKAERLVQKFIDAGEDVEEATEALEELKIAEKAKFEQTIKAEKEAAIAEAKQAEENKKKFIKYVNETVEIIPETKISPTMRKELLTGMTKPVSFDANGNPLDIVGDFLNKGGHEARYKLAYLIKLTDGGKNMGVLSAKQAVKQTTQKLNNLLKAPSTSVGFTKEESDLDTNVSLDMNAWDQFLK